VAASRQLWGAETAKAVANFPISGETMPVPVVRWLARLKGAAAAVNGELGLLPKRTAARIGRAAAEIAAGKHDDQFPIDVFQTGSGTSSNMNANEVLAALAGEDVHPNDDVNMGALPGRGHTPATTSTWASPPTTCSPPPCTSPPSTWPRGNCCPR